MATAVVTKRPTSPTATASSGQSIPRALRRQAEGYLALTYAFMDTPLFKQRGITIPRAQLDVRMYDADGRIIGQGQLPARRAVPGPVTRRVRRGSRRGRVRARLDRRHGPGPAGRRPAGDRRCGRDRRAAAHDGQGRARDVPAL